MVIKPNSDTKILYRSECWQKRITRESLEIALNSPLINQEEDAHLIAAWLPLHDKLQGNAAAWVLTAHS